MYGTQPIKNISSNKIEKLILTKPQQEFVWSEPRSFIQNLK